MRDHRQRHLAEGLERACPVNDGSFLQTLRHTLEGGQINNHHIADTVPQRHNNDRIKGYLGVPDPQLVKEGHRGFFSQLR
ncbi:hypothetical protein D3C75_1228230 [compost metagenome]